MGLLLAIGTFPRVCSLFGASKGVMFSQDKEIHTPYLHRSKRGISLGCPLHLTIILTARTHKLSPTDPSVGISTEEGGNRYCGLKELQITLNTIHSLWKVDYEWHFNIHDSRETSYKNDSSSWGLGCWLELQERTASYTDTCITRWTADDRFIGAWAHCRMRRHRSQVSYHRQYPLTSLMLASTVRSPDNQIHNRRRNTNDMTFLPIMDEDSLFSQPYVLMQKNWGNVETDLWFCRTWIDDFLHAHISI